jgi:ornithine cyclodeaminase/alanine dehydrogenase-like protein (mu-crystallin family)
VLPFLGPDLLADRLTWTDAIGALDAALRAGLEPDWPRGVHDLGNGQLLNMPAHSRTGLGVKLVTIAAPGTVDRVQGLYILFDRDTLAPAALLDGPALTALRTAAHSALAVRHLAAPGARSLAVFGAGPQARAHIAAIRAVRPIEHVTVLTRHPESVAGFDLPVETRNASYGVPAGADIIVCATTARTPVLDGRDVPDHACVVAIGSHEPDARELDDQVMRRASRVVVEDRATALREAGDVIAAVASGALDPDRLIEMRAAIDLEPCAGISVFKGVGMGWQDLAIAQAAYRKTP